MSNIFTAIGLMSGTSMDGIDVAVLRTDGEAYVERLPFIHFHPFSDQQRELIAQAMSQARALCPSLEEGVPLGERQAALRAHFAAVEQMLTEQHIAAVEALLAKAGLQPADIDVVAMHGQTVLHLPRPGGFTLQLGDGQALAERLRVKVVADFRSADVAAGGEGAPLVPAYHQALVEAAGLERPVAVVNVGGVANVTFVGDDGELVAFDTGPGNALIDDWMSMTTGRSIDCDGACAAGGAVSETALTQLLDNDFFDTAPPKSLDRNTFSLAPVEELPPERGAATLTSFTALAVARADFFFPMPPKHWVICGGGARNKTLMREFHRRLDGIVTTADEHGWSSDFMEAEAFAYLGVRSLRNLAITFPSTTGAPRELTGGHLFTPRP